MTEHAPAIFIALEASSFAAAIRQSNWIYMTANVAHIASLFFFAGAIAVMDLRLSGALAATSPGHVLKMTRRVALFAFAGLAASGFVLFAAEASHVVINPVFQVKAALIVTGLLNVAYFEYFLAPKVNKLKPLKPMPRDVRMAGFISVGLWLLVAICGRTIAYF